MKSLVFSFCVAALVWAGAARGAILWSDLGDTRVRDNFPGTDILGGAVREDDTSTNTLYFKLHVDPWSDTRTELYKAAFQLFEGDNERLAVGEFAQGVGVQRFSHERNRGEQQRVWRRGFAFFQPGFAGIGHVFYL